MTQNYADTKFKSSLTFQC